MSEMVFLFGRKYIWVIFFHQGLEPIYENYQLQTALVFTNHPYLHYSYP